jgi:hypothetical protein
MMHAHHINVTISLMTQGREQELLEPRYLLPILPYRDHYARQSLHHNYDRGINASKK